MPENGYTFVSYAHKDRKKVFREVERREKSGQVFWCDKRIEAGSDWAESIGSNLAGAKSVLFFDSPNSRKSENCKRELAFAEEHGIPVETVKLAGSGVVIAGVICLAGVLALLLYFAILKTVPMVVGFETHKAVKKLDESGFKETIRYEYSEIMPMGLISEQKAVSFRGKGFPFVPVRLVQSLGKEESLTIAPDTVGSYVSEGVKMLADANLLKFTITAENLNDNEFGIITYQSVPAGYKVSTENNVGLMVAANENPVIVEYKGVKFTLPAEEGSSVSVDLAENTVEYIEPYDEGESREPGGGITIAAKEFTVIKDKYFNEPVTVSGDGVRILFSNCRFDSDIINTGNIGTEIILDKDCVVNGECIIRGTRTTASIEEVLPKFIMQGPCVVRTEGGCIGNAGSMSGQMVVLNGKTYTGKDITVYHDADTDEYLDYTGQDYTCLAVATFIDSNTGRQRIAVCCEYDE